jgi:hypothetical protein
MPPGQSRTGRILLTLNLQQADSVPVSRTRKFCASFETNRCYVVQSSRSQHRARMKPGCRQIAGGQFTHHAPGADRQRGVAKTMKICLGIENEPSWQIHKTKPGPAGFTLCRCCGHRARPAALNCVCSRVLEQRAHPRANQKKPWKFVVGSRAIDRQRFRRVPWHLATEPSHYSPQNPCRHSRIKILRANCAIDSDQGNGEANRIRSPFRMRLSRGGWCYGLRGSPL